MARLMRLYQRSNKSGGEPEGCQNCGGFLGGPHETIQHITHAFVAFLALLAIVIAQACRDAAVDSEGATTEIRLTEHTMAGNEAEASNGPMSLRVRGLYQQMFSGEWYLGMKARPLRGLTVSKIRYYLLSANDAVLGVSEKTFFPPAGKFERLVDVDVDVPFSYSATPGRGRSEAASMLVIFYDQRGHVLSKFEITNIH